MLTFDSPKLRQSLPQSAAAAWQQALAGRSPQSTPASASEAHWRLLRDVQRPQDLVLSPLAQRWAERFPRAQRPSHLLQQFPRIANRLALCWADQKLTGMVLFELVIDKRGGRRGFPPEVLADLRQLRAWLSDADAWGADHHSWEQRAQAVAAR